MDAFCENDSLKSVTLPNGVTTIDGEAFYACPSLERITIPNSVKRIEQAAFASCPSLRDIYFNGTKEEWALIEFDEEWNIDPEFSIYHVNENPPTREITVHCTDGNAYVDDPYGQYNAVEDCAGNVSFLTDAEYDEYIDELIYQGAYDKLRALGMLLCPNCGCELSSEDTVCPECGAKVEPI